MTEEKPPLPTLDDVLHRRSQPPVCLFNYYIVLRDRLHLEPLLDFWLDVAQADILYKRYLKYATRPPTPHHQTHATLPIRPSNISSSILSHDDLFTHMLLTHPRNSLATTIASTKKPPPTIAQMTDTVERIYLRYIVSNAEKELPLPHRIKEEIAKHFVGSEKPKSTALFGEAKQYVRDELQRTFGLFLRYKVCMNVTWPQQVGRLAAGLIALLVGFSYEFSMVFLDVRPWQTRLWGALPIGLGVFFVVSSLTGIDPLWVLAFNLSETVTFQFNPIVQARVKSILRKRSLWVVGIMIVVTLILMVFFCGLTGNRL